MTETMTDYFELGSTPPEEECAQVGTPGYHEKALTECVKYIQLIRKVCGPEPHGAQLATKWFNHDFGRYAEVVVYFEDGSEAGLSYAQHVEQRGPKKWDGAGGEPFQPVPGQGQLTTEPGQDNGKGAGNGKAGA